MNSLTHRKAVWSSGWAARNARHVVYHQRALFLALVLSLSGERLEHAQASTNGQEDYNTCMKASEAIKDREMHALNTRQPQPAPTAPGATVRALPLKMPPQEAILAIDKAESRRVHECQVQLDIRTKTHEKTIEAQLAKQRVENLALYERYKTLPTPVPVSAAKADQNHQAKWGYMMYQNPGYNDPAPNLGELDVLIYTQVFDLTRLEAPPDRLEYVNNFATRWERQGKRDEPVDADTVAALRTRATSVEWFVVHLAKDFNITLPRSDSLFFYGLEQGHLVVVTRDLRCKDNEDCTFTTKEQAEAARQAEMKVSTETGSVRFRIVELKEHD